MILGVGIDLVDVDRVQRSLDRFGERFLARILHPAEIAYCRAHPQPAIYVAARFAAKEAVSKAFGTGIGRHLGWHDLEIGHTAGGKPIVVLHGTGRELLHRCGGRIVHLSLSHTAHQATAVAVLEGDGPPAAPGVERVV